MDKQTRLNGLKIGNYTPNHAKVAASVLTRLDKQLTDKGYNVIHDIQNFNHIVIQIKPTGFVSLYCNGFDKNIYIQKLGKTGSTDNRYQEKGFATIKGAVNFILKKYQS